MSGIEAISDILQKTFTRYFIPGFVFYIVAICLPYFIAQNSLKIDKLELFSGSVALVFSAILGYLLDGIGSYSLHFHARAYEKEKKDLTRKLNCILHSPQSTENIYFSKCD